MSAGAGPSRGPGLQLPSRAWTPIAMGVACVSLLAGILATAPVGPFVALAGGSVATLLALAALQRSHRASNAARAAMLALAIGVASLGLGAALTL